MNPSFRRRLPGRFYAKVIRYLPKLKSFTPPNLKANRQIRNEALAVFFAVNDFVFEDCDARYLQRWIFGAVQPQHLRYIRSIT